MGKIVAVALKKLAEGEFGEPAKKVYWAFAGKKTLIGFGFAVGYFALNEAHNRGLCAQCGDWSMWLIGASAFMASIGLVDGALRTAQPEPPKP